MIVLNIIATGVGYTAIIAFLLWFAGAMIGSIRDQIVEAQDHSIDLKSQLVYANREIEWHIEGRASLQKENAKYREALEYCAGGGDNCQDNSTKSLTQLHTHQALYPPESTLKGAS